MHGLLPPADYTGANMPYSNAEDQRESWRRHYDRNKEQYLDRNAQRRAECKQYVRDAKQDKPCADCGVVYPHYVMDFDHRDPAQKVGTVSRLAHDGSIKKLQTEIEKCDLVCANCHRIRTHSEG